MSTADIAVAFLGAEGLVMTGTAAYLGHQLVRRVAAPKQSASRSTAGTVGTAAVTPITETEGRAA